MGSWPKMADGDAGYVFTVQPCSQTAAPFTCLAARWQFKSGCGPGLLWSMI